MGKTRRRWLQSVMVLAGATLAGTSTATELPSREFSPGGFSRIEIDLPADVSIQPTSSANVRVSAESQVLERLVVTVRNDTLVVSSEGSFQTTKPILAVIGAPVLEHLSVLGASTVVVEPREQDTLAASVNDSAELRLDALNLRTLELDIDGSGSVEATGSTSHQRLRLSDAGSFEGSELASRTADLQVSGAGEARIQVSDALSAVVDDAGTVAYSGNPKVDSTVKGAGELERE